MADTSFDFSLEQPLEDCIKRVEAKPFHSSFVQQVDAAEELYGIQIHFNFGAKEVQKELQMLNEGYSEEDHYAGRALLGNRCADMHTDGLNRKRIRWKYKQKRMAAYGMRKILLIHEAA